MRDLRHRPGGRLTAALVLLPLALAVRLEGAPAGKSTPSAAPPSLTPPEILTDKISLAEALRLTVDHSPDVLLARQEVDRRRGLLQQATGQFDSLVLFSPQFLRQKTVLTLTQLRPEIAKRQFLSESSANLTTIATDIAKGLTDDKGVALPDCKGRQYYINGSAICLDFVSPTDVGTAQALIDGQAASASIPQDSPSARLAKALAEQQRRRLTTILFLLRKVFIPALNAQFQAIGALPTLNNTDTFDFDLRYSLSNRWGLTVAPILFFEGIRDNFADKSDNPALGGKGVPTLYRSVVGFTLDLPLLRGAGKDSVAAAENSARENYRAALESLAHAAAQSVLRTTLAYWNLAGSQELLTLYERSADAQKKIGEATAALVQADELPRTELDRAAARVGDVEAAIAAARRDMATNRVELARAIGLGVPDEAHAPLAADPLPALSEAAPPDGAALKGLLDEAVARRADAKAARFRLSASEILVKGARVDLKPQLNLSLQAGYNGIYEDAKFDVLNVFDPTGYGRTFQGAYVGPSFQLTLSFQLPFKNNTQKGRFVQADSLAGNVFIAKADLERTIRGNVAQLTDSVRVAADEVRVREEAVRNNDELVTSAFERFRAGETTLLETLKTEQAQTQARADLAAARLMYASQASRLRFESGTLLPYAIRDDAVSFGEATPTGPVPAERP